MNSTTVSGRFVRPDGTPTEGMIKFIPQKMWLTEGGMSYPCLAPEVRLVDGRFIVELTCTDTGPYPWFYTVETPIGTWSIQVKGSESLHLVDLLPHTAT